MVIAGPLRLPLLTIEWIFAVILLELGLYFLIKYMRQEKQLRTSKGMGYSAFFFDFSLTWFYLIIGNYYASEKIESIFLWDQGSMRALFINFSYLCLITACLLFAFSMEKHRIYLFKKYFFTICFLSLTITSLIVFFINLEIIKIIPFIVWPLFLVFLTIYLVDFFKAGVKAETIVIELLKFIPAFILLAVGFFLSHDYFMQNLALEFRLGGSLLQLLALISLAYFSIGLPAFAEYDWREKVEELLLMNKSGICLIHKSFTDQINHLNEVLMSGALLSVNILLEELTSAKVTGSSIIKKKGKTVNIFSSTHLTGVLISQEELNTINYYLKEFIQKVEKVYQNVFADWDGDIDVFAPVGTMIDEFFT
ncbi:MAG: hypothetical protein HWN65_10400 [Candidatus Helarchaeota archaeon]|nr:hypothetical protein [Candidatus Helarchaeota archaeon]